MNVIFGSGVVGLLAKMMLGPEWKVIPFHRSRFFSWNPALDDNFIIHDDEILPFIKEITTLIGQPKIFPYKRSWSIAGELVNQFDSGACQDWLYKIFGNNIPPHASIYMKDRMNLYVYDVRVNQLYFDLVNANIGLLRAEAEKGPVTEIGPHYYVRNGVREDFDKAISTIPLDALCELMNIEVNLPARNLHYIHLETEDLDFEGANQLFVVDKIFDFWKVTNVAPNRYMLYFHNDVVNYGVYLMNFIKKFEILDGTAMERAIPLGSIPSIPRIEQAGIFCVGAYAQWDWCADVGSNILRLIRYAGRGNKPQQMKSI